MVTIWGRRAAIIIDVYPIIQYTNSMITERFGGGQKLTEIRAQGIRDNFRSFYAKDPSSSGEAGGLDHQVVSIAEDSVVRALMINKAVLESKAWDIDNLAYTDPFMAEEIEKNGLLVNNKNGLMAVLSEPADDGSRKNKAEIEAIAERYLRAEMAQRMTRIRLAVSSGYKKGDWEEFDKRADVIKAGSLAYGAIEFDFNWIEPL